MQPFDNIFTEVGDEIIKAELKHGPQMDIPLGCNSQEFGRMAERYKELTDFDFSHGYGTWMHIAREEAYETFAEDEPAKIRAEALQAAAMFVRIVQRCDIEIAKA